MNNEPVAWRKVVGNVTKHYQYNEMGEGTPLYTHPSEHDLGIAEAIGFEKGHKSAEDMLRQQQAEIEALKAGKIRAYNNGVEDGRKPNTNLVKEAKYGITTKWDGITTYHETTEPIGKVQEK